MPLLLPPLLTLLSPLLLLSLPPQGIESLLRPMAVQYLVLPSIRTNGVLEMWKNKFNFCELTEEGG